MHKNGVTEFPNYYVGINSLAELATKDDRVCVINILGGESRTVTPTSNVFSGGNIVFGTGPGRSGQVLETSIGNVPVYNSVREGIEAGHEFNTGVIYLPPSGVKDGVAELVGANPKLKKVIILTEKVSQKDSATIRAICQSNGVDVFGANCLGIADAWNHIRLGGALGGSKPEESLVKGTVALFSNSGNFTTTIAVYLLTQGWGTTTSISSGKDVYIHYALPEFLHALNNDDRSKCAVVYIEPGGYYEHGLEFKKPTVACIVGRWKAKLTKACGHAGSLAGSGDDAAAKERWFMDYFDVDDIYTPTNPVVSKKGAVVINIAHIPDALTAVMKLNNEKSDFEPKGNLNLKCWFSGDAGLKIPEELDSPVVEAVAPYNEQIEAISRQKGAQFPRETMKDTSGASMMDPKTQVSRIHNISILDASKRSFEENLVMSLTHGYPSEYSTKLANIALNGYVAADGTPELIASDASRKAGNSPNTVVTAAVSIIGKETVAKATGVTKHLLELFEHTGLTDPEDDFDYSAILKGITDDEKACITAADDDARAPLLTKAVSALKGGSVFIKFVTEAAGGKPSSDALLGAIWTTIGWSQLMNKRISKVTLTGLAWHSRIFSAIVGCSVVADKHKGDSFCGVSTGDLLGGWSFTETAFLALIGKRPSVDEMFEFSTLLGLIITNGPGTISAQGSKGAVSADGPEVPERVQINKAVIGFLTHTGFAHGGNGYEAIEFLIERFKEKGLKDPASKEHGFDLKAIADEYARSYAEYKAHEKAIGNIGYKKIPCVNHPIFKGKPVNFDPRERFVSELFESKGIGNVFLDFYRELVQALFDAKVSREVYCVNVDAVIAVILLKMVWTPFMEGTISEKEVESAGFTTFLFGRMIGCAAEIDDHINRGRNMDTRTAASKCNYVG
jgi:succinyl-CoA synthetase alpha subunit